MGVSCQSKFICPKSIGQDGVTAGLEIVGVHCLDQFRRLDIQVVVAHADLRAASEKLRAHRPIENNEAVKQVFEIFSCHEKHSYFEPGCSIALPSTIR